MSAHREPPPQDTDPLYGDAATKRRHGPKGASARGSAGGVVPRQCPPRSTASTASDIHEPSRSSWPHRRSADAPHLSDRVSAKSPKLASNVGDAAQPQYKVEYREIQPFGTLKRLPLALDDNARAQSVATLNQILADTMTLRDLYKKHHWQMSGATFYQLHLLLDKHYEEQAVLVDLIAERIMALGGISIAMAPDVAEATKIPRPPKGREDVPTQLARILEAHEIILRQARDGADAADEAGDDGTNDLLVSNVIRANEPEVWFVAEHLAETDLIRADR